MDEHTNKTVNTISKHCRDEAERQMQGHLAALHALAVEQLLQLHPGAGQAQLKAEDLLNAAWQSDGIRHPRIAAAIEAQAAENLRLAIDNTLSTMKAAKNAAKLKA